MYNVLQDTADKKQKEYNTSLKNAAVAVNLGVSILGLMIGKELSKLQDDEEAKLLTAFMANELNV